MRRGKTGGRITRREFLLQAAAGAALGAGTLSAAGCGRRGPGSSVADDAGASGSAPRDLQETAKVTMEYRELGSTGLKVSAIGLGTEHLEQSRSNMKEVLDVAVAAGLNYIDVLYDDPQGAADFWDGFAPAIRPHRDKLILAAHWGPSYYGNPRKGRRCFEEILSRVGNDYVDVAMIAVIDTEEQWDDWGAASLETLLRYKEQGRVGRIGMSGHYVSTATKAVESGAIDVLMFGVNLLSRYHEPTLALLQTCRDRGVGLVAMKPYHGGTLFNVRGKPTSITPSQCLSYVLSQPVSTTVPGAKNAEELRQTLHYLEATAEERDYQPAVEAIPTYYEGVCTRCNHCLPCPRSIDIGTMMTLLEFAEGGASSDDLRAWYESFEIKASACNQCDVCVPRCPFNVDIIASLDKVVQLFES
jgi:predicted aldo/keto reductase-like oxidoreductase